MEIKHFLKCFYTTLSRFSFLKRACQFYTNERLFWFVAISLSCWNMSAIFILMLKTYFADSISISVETSFLHWNITFPSVTFCLAKDRANAEVADFTNQHNINYVKNIHNYLFITPININTKEYYCKGLNTTCGVNVHVARKILLTQFCEAIMEKITYLDNEYQNCEQIFKFHELEMGYCFLANNIIDFFSSCMTDLRIILELKHCNCTLYISPKKYFNYYCDFRGMSCISRADITSKAKQIAREKYICYPSCSELKLHFVGSNEIIKTSNSELTQVEIKVQNTPSLRCLRSVTQTHLDLVVSAGGVLGLFVGTSMLSAIEILYFGFKNLIS